MLAFCSKWINLHDSTLKFLNKNVINVLLPSEIDVKLIETETMSLPPYEQSVSSSFLRSLGLMKIKSEKTTVESVPLSESRVTDDDKNAGGSHTSANEKLQAKIRSNRKRSRSKSVAASSTAKKSLVEKKKHVSKTKDLGEKKRHAESLDEPQSIPAVVSVKEQRKLAAPATDKPKKQKHKASTPAKKGSSSAPKSTVMTAENLSEFTDADGESILWKDILESEFKSENYTMLLRKCQFTEEQIQDIRKTFQYLYQKFCRRPTKHQRFMKTYSCTECNFSMSHECTSLVSTDIWNNDCYAPCVELITPESITMCRCNFTAFHSHITQSETHRRTISLEPSPSHNFLRSNRTTNFKCSKCHMNVFVTNRFDLGCAFLLNFLSAEDGNRKNFRNYVAKHLDYERRDYPTIHEFYSCSNLCCMVFHRCVRDVIDRKSDPLQPHEVSLCCQPKVRMESVQPSVDCPL